MYPKSSIEQLVNSLMGGYKLKMKDNPMWITLPETPNTHELAQLYRNPAVQFSFNLFDHDVELYQITYGDPSKVVALNNEIKEILQKARESGGIK